MVEAWFMDDSEDDQRLPHRKEPNEPVSLEHLESLGVAHWKLDPQKGESDPELQRIRDEQGYTYADVVTVSPDKLPNYEEKLKAFFEEHLHADKEIRYCLEGSGYFDVRDRQDRWIRIKLDEGDLITLPAGIYHRFTLDSDNYIKAMRLFVGDPVWTPLNRPVDDHPARTAYLRWVEGTDGDGGAGASEAAQACTSGAAAAPPTPSSMPAGCTPPSPCPAPSPRSPRRRAPSPLPVRADVDALLRNAGLCVWGGAGCCAPVLSFPPRRGEEGWRGAGLRGYCVGSHGCASRPPPLRKRL